MICWRWKAYGWIGSLLPFLGFSIALALTQPSQIEETVVRGLRWYFHWQGQVPKGGALSCRGQTRGKYALVSCNPGSVTLTLSRSEKGSFEVLTIHASRIGFSEELRLFESYSDGEPENFLFPIQTGDVADYHVDRAASEDHERAVRPFLQDVLRSYEKSGAKPQFWCPLVSSQDPFYSVYLVKDKTLDSVWLFPVRDGRPQGHSSWVYDERHKNIPEVAASHLTDLDRWYGSIQ